MKHIELFENFSNKNPLYVIDLMKEFPDMYQQEPLQVDSDDPDSDYYGEEQATLSIYEIDPNERIEEDDPYTHIDPSFENKPFSLKLVVETTDKLHYVSENTIYIGLDDNSKESVLKWFGDLLNDSSRDYLST